MSFAASQCVVPMSALPAGRRWLCLLRQACVFLLSGVLACAHAADEPLEIELNEGVSYEKVRGAQSTYRDGVIEVVEFFWYGCSHCYEFLPLLTEWEENLPGDVRFEALALGESARWTLDAKVYFAARALGLPEDFHRNFFLARHSADIRSRPVSSEDMADFFVRAYGKKMDFDRGDFLATMDSFSVVGRVKSALSRAKSAGISSVPEVLVDGRFRVNRRSAGSYANVIKVVDQLLELVRHEHAVKPGVRDSGAGAATVTKAPDDLDAAKKKNAAED